MLQALRHRSPRSTDVYVLEAARLTRSRRYARRGPTGWPITWQDRATLAQHVSRREQELPIPGAPISTGTLRNGASLRVLASLLAAMPIWVIRLGAFPREGAIGSAAGENTQLL